MGAIYRIRFAGSRRCYIGSSKKPHNRRRSHVWLLRRGTHHCRALQNAAVKYGIDSLIFEIVWADIPDDFLIAAEQCWLDHHGSDLYNRLRIAAPRPHDPPKPATIAKRRSLMIGNQLRKGIPHSDEDKIKISEGLRRSYALNGRKAADRSGHEQFLDRIKRGEIRSPFQRKPASILAILTDLAETKSARITGERLGMTGENVRAVYRNAASEMLEFGIFRAPRRGGHGQFIHPDWFDMLEASNATSVY